MGRHCRQRTQRCKRAQCVQNYDSSVSSGPSTHLWVSLLGCILLTTPPRSLLALPSQASLAAMMQGRVHLPSALWPTPCPDPSPVPHHSPPPAAPSRCWLTSCSSILGTPSRRSILQPSTWGVYLLASPPHHTSQERPREDFKKTTKTCWGEII